MLLERELELLFGPLNSSLPVRSFDLAYVLSLCADDVDAPGVLFGQKSFLGRETGPWPPSGEPVSISSWKVRGLHNRFPPLRSAHAATLESALDPF